MLKVKKSDLENLLKRVQRVSFINNKPIPQVLGCVLETKEDTNVVATTNIVRDGISSVGTFICDTVENDGERYIIPNIEKMLGVLKPHSGLITLSSKEDKLVVKSSNKQTTITADSRALAFPHTKKTITEWNKESKERMDSVDTLTGGYTMRDGSIREPCATLHVMGSDLKDAINSGNINGQKINRCVLEWDGDKLFVESGNIHLGKTKTCVASTEPQFSPFEFEFEGGLENCLPDSQVTLNILDFNPESQGYSMVILADDCVIFQRGVI